MENEAKSTETGLTKKAERDPFSLTESDWVKLWKERVHIAKSALDDWAKDPKVGVERFIKEYNGEFESINFQGLKGKIPVPPVNDIYAYVDADVSNTYNRDPFISVNAKAGTVEGARLWETILNYYWRKLRTKEEVEPEIIDKDLTGFAWHKVGRDVETEGPEEELKIVKDEIYSKRVDWRDVVYNLDSSNPPHDCMWMAQRITKPMKFIRAKYPNAKAMKGTKSPEVSEDAFKKSTFKDDISVGVIWEIWDRETRQVYLVGEGLEHVFLENPRPWPEYQDEFPFIYYWDTYAPGQPRPMSAIAPWEPQVWEKMVLLAAAVNHSKRWNRQILVRQGALSPEALDKIERGDDGAIIEYTGMGDLAQNMEKLDWGTLPVDFYLLMDRCSAIQRDVSGQPEFARGGVTKTTTRTEGELQMIAQGAKGRSDRRIDRFETHLENIARHMLMHLKADFDFEEAIRITGWAPDELLAALGDRVDPATGEVSFTADELNGEYDVEVRAGSTLPLNKETKGQIIDNILQVVGSLSTQGVSPLLEALITERLEEFDIKSLKQAYEQEKEQSRQAAMMQQQDSDANAAKAKSQAAKNIASADKTGAEADKVRMEPPFAPMHPDVKKEQQPEEPAHEGQEGAD